MHDLIFLKLLENYIHARFSYWYVVNKELIGNVIYRLHFTGKYTLLLDSLSHMKYVVAAGSNIF